MSPFNKQIFFAFVLLIVVGGIVGVAVNTNTNTGGFGDGILGSRPGLDLSGRGLTSVPQDVFSRTDLTNLDLSSNNLTGALPAEIRHLKHLRTLNLSHNQFTGVPAEIGQLTDLEVLDLSYNFITGLPHELGHLTNLKILNLTGNDYSTYDLDIIKQTLPKGVDILTDEIIACTAEAKICPDGSAVGRVGPNCEFAACPGEGDADAGGGEWGILPYASGVRGVVTRGPMCPVVREGDNSCADQPVSTDVYLYRTGSSVPFATVISDKSGQFQFNVPPGNYTLNAKNTSGITTECSPTSVTIGSDQTVVADISCDTGIR